MIKQREQILLELIQREKFLRPSEINISQAALLWDDQVQLTDSLLVKLFDRVLLFLIRFSKLRSYLLNLKSNPWKHWMYANLARTIRIGSEDE